MAKKANKTGFSTSDTSGAGAAAAPKKSTASRTQKHLKAQASGVVAAVEGFVSAITNTPVATEKSMEAPAAPVIAEPVFIESEAIAQAPAIHKEVTHEEIAKLAYIFYLNRGTEGGSQAEDWLRAEQTLHSR